MEDKFYKQLLDTIQDGVYYVDLGRTITFWNKGAERITGYTASEVVGSSCADSILRHVTEQGVDLCAKGCPLSATMKDGKNHEAEVFLHHKKGHRLPVLVRATPMRNDKGRITGAVETFSVVTGKLQSLEELEGLRKEVFTDALTGVGNRKLAEASLEQRMTDLTRHNVPFGLLFVDIDRFKDINDTYGHAVGDKTLQMVARTMAGTLRSMDELCRWGGEEFLVIFHNVDQARLCAAAERLRVLVQNSWLQVDDARVETTVSVGGVLADDPKQSLEELLEIADRRMYRCKESGRNCCALEDCC